MTDVTKSKVETLFGAMMEAEFEFIDAASHYYLGPCGDADCPSKGETGTDAHDRMDNTFFAYADARVKHSDAEEQEPVRVG